MTNYFNQLFESNKSRNAPLTSDEQKYGVIREADPTQPNYQAWSEAYGLPNSNDTLSSGLAKGAGLALMAALSGGLGKTNQLPHNTEIPITDVLEHNNGVLRKEYHGSSEPILEPQSGKTLTGTKGPDVFFTTPDRNVANSFGFLRSFQKNGPEAFNYGKIPEAAITENYMKKGNQFELQSPVNIDKANEIANLLGISKEDLNQSLANSISHQGVDADNLWNNLIARHNTEGEMGNLMDIGKSAIDRLRGAGYNRMRINTNPGSDALETIHFSPESDVFPIGSKKLNELQESLKPKDIPNDSLSNILMNLLGKKPD